MKVTMFAISSLVVASVCNGEDLKPLNAKVMVYGYCFAGSRADKEAIGGYGPSDNAPKKVTDKKLGKSGTVSLLALPTETVPFARSYQGFRLLLINRTSTEASFDACNSSLSITQEALDENGKWRPIESLPSSGCGNSYHRVFLPPGHYWEFVAPQYTGAHRTKLRFSLEGKEPIHSNEFEGSIELQQFKVKGGARSQIP